MAELDCPVLFVAAPVVTRISAILFVPETLEEEKLLPAAFVAEAAGVLTTMLCCCMLVSCATRKSVKWLV